MSEHLPKHQIYNLNNLDLLKDMASNSLDCVVTDCPYGYGEEPDPVETLQAWLTKGFHEIKGVGFMGKKWDSFVPQPLLWKEVFRVLKPGGYVLAFFGTRTYDWGTLAIRLGGFEIRDCIQWIYGSGFPKSQDVSKAFDKKAGVQREQEIKSVGDISNSRYMGKDESPRVDKLVSVGAPITEEAKTWEGYGTALKPACELICVARKPIEGTVIENILKYGTGAINIDGCRIDSVIENHTKAGPSQGKNSLVYFFNPLRGTNPVQQQREDEGLNPRYDPLGRWPANVIFDEEAACILDYQTGVLKSGAPGGVKTGNNNDIYSPYGGGLDVTGYGDSGGASRFFYCAKASKEDRDYGLEGFEARDPASVTDFRPTLKTHPENWAYTESAYKRTTKKVNFHPTVKPISLMRYLVRLVKTPLKSFTIADFFCGSGTTGVACMLEGVNFIACDEDEDSFKLAQARVEYAKKDYLKELSKPVQSSLFAPKKGPETTNLTLF